ncbi:MAG: hypothetical protein EOP54_12845 [Sphingobacteriales bacterium]|nr:MAG: hypothetical protein EOP54_12845 [Sphingobacteriales bacterium]
MYSSSFKEDLITISNDILIPIDFHEKLVPAIIKYHELLCHSAVINAAGENDREHVKTAHGNAIGPFWAANCVKEVFRTQRFVQGLQQAITDLHSKGREKVHVLYAGTGPFATLALPIMLTFAPAQVQFTLLEINEDSMARLKRLLEELGLMAYVRRIELADAADYILKDTDIDILISETMNLALYREPQVSIMLNLGQQLKKETILIPQEIKVSFLGRWNSGDKIEPVKTLFQFNADYIRQKLQEVGPKRWKFEKSQLALSLQADEQLCYLTDVQIYKDFRLGLNDCSLTLPKLLKPFGLAGEINLEFEYQVSDIPGFLATATKIEQHSRSSNNDNS